MAGKDNQKQGVRLMPALMLIGVFAVIYLCAIAMLTPEKYNVRAGDLAPETISSPRTIENTQATEALRELARNEAKAVYALHEELIEEYTKGAEKFFSDIDVLRQDAEVFRSNSADDQGAWRDIIPNAQMENLIAKFDIAITADEGFHILDADKADILRLEDAVMPRLTTSLSGGLEEQSLQAKKTAYVQELNATGIPDALKAIGSKVFDAYLKPTFIVDEQATNKARESAAAAVDPIEIKRGDIIVRHNEVINQQQYELMRSLELIRADSADLWLNIGVAMYLLITGAGLFVYLLLFRLSVLQSVKHMLIISTAMTLTILLAFALYAVDRRICTSLLGVLLVALLVDHKTAMAVNIALSLCLGLLCGGRGASMLGFDSMTMMLSSFMGGQAGIYMLRGYSSRGAIITAGGVSGAVGAFAAAAAYTMTAKTFKVLLISAAWAAGSDLVAALLVIGMLPLFETVFDVATSARLNELSNANNPLLKQLMTEAPGTYHHSMMTAALAESAAQAIGADPLLSRVGAYYHDVGKLKRPLYFMENQKPNDNIHDTLPAQESAAIIIAHQRDGLNMLLKHKLPSAVIQIAFEHHGTTLMAYFYHKAVKENGGRQLAQKPFRYPGARPSSKESAIVMLADSCEAAVRSLNSPTREDVESLVDKVIKGKIDDGQLALSPLNFKEVNLIRQSFMRTFSGLMHDRIAYPDAEEKSR